MVQFQQAVAVENMRAVERDTGGTRRHGSGGDHDMVRFQHFRRVLPCDGKCMRADKFGFAADNLDFVADHMLPNDFHLGADDLLAACDQVFNRDFRLAAPAAAIAVKAALLNA